MRARSIDCTIPFHGPGSNDANSEQTSEIVTQFREKKFVTVPIEIMSGTGAVVALTNETMRYHMPSETIIAIKKLGLNFSLIAV